MRIFPAIPGGEFDIETCVLAETGGDDGCTVKRRMVDEFPAAIGFSHPGQRNAPHGDAGPKKDLPNPAHNPAHEIRKHRLSPFRTTCYREKQGSTPATRDPGWIRTSGPALRKPLSRIV
ncbi:MAG: hypothetical protein WDM91_22250 [Rhizomicrobium sp.]